MAKQTRYEFETLATAVDAAKAEVAKRGTVSGGSYVDSEGTFAAIFTVETSGPGSYNHPKFGVTVHQDEAGFYFWT